MLSWWNMLVYLAVCSDAAGVGSTLDNRPAVDTQSPALASHGQASNLPIIDVMPSVKMLQIRPLLLGSASNLSFFSRPQQLKPEDGRLSEMVKTKHYENTQLHYGDCSGPWCSTIERFNAQFDSNDPQKMQSAMDSYTEWATDDEGLKLALTKRHYYEMYHHMVADRTREYLPTGCFTWTFDDKFALVDRPSTDEVRLARTGRIDVQLGWWKRRVFWSMAVKKLPGGAVFFDQTNDNFGNCHGCHARMLYRLRRGGLSGGGSEWKIVGFVIQKLT